MAYLKPRAIETKFFNPLAMRSTMWDVHTLEVARRNDVEPQRVPVIPLEQDGSLFVVSTRGEADWVKNVRAAGIVRLGQKGKFVKYAATEVPPDERSGIVTAYRKKAGREVDRYWKKLPEDADHPTFRLTPS
jgi:deazaflavin-dependent oxidoreductase (nitroreductase family)